MTNVMVLAIFADVGFEGIAWSASFNGYGYVVAMMAESFVFQMGIRVTRGLSAWALTAP